MKVLVIGTRGKIDELLLALVGKQEVTVVELVERDSLGAEVETFEGFDVIFDLNCDDEALRLSDYISLKDKVVIVSAFKMTLAEMASGEKIECKLFGMNTLGTCINRPLWEMTLYNRADEKDLSAVMGSLGVGYKVVADRIGMVTARVLVCIMNEAIRMVEEGSASEADIDNAMKLGVNYPKGPISWLQEAGVEDVVELLWALGATDGSGKYSVCGLLEERYYKSRN